MTGKGPTFICIGAQKAGTTWLCANLRRHPDVAMPPLKEIHYFDEIYREVQTGLLRRFLAVEGMNKWWWKEKIYPSFESAIRRRNIKDLRWCFRYFFLPRNFDWYDKLFCTVGKKVTGDITPDYCILSKKVVQKIYERYPHLKIIYIIRNPIDRAWSALKMRYVKRRHFLLEEIDEHLVEAYYQEFGEFNDIERTILNWGSYFPPNQFHIGFYDELVEMPEVFFERVLIFLGLGKNHDSSKLKKKVFQGVTGNIPAPLEPLLIQKNIEQIRFLRDYLPEEQRTYPEKWLEEIENRVGEMPKRKHYDQEVA